MSGRLDPELENRIAAAEQQLQRLTQELVEIKGLAEGARVEVTLEPEPARTEPSTAKPPLPVAPPLPAPAPAPRKPRPWEREIDYGELIGAKGLAWAGGIVTVLGVVFFFVLAVNRGWIGPSERVALGGVASLVVFAAGLWVHRRFGPVYSAYAAVGAGLAGGYATLIAAAALYELVSDAAALGIAAGIAAVGLATSLYWGSELVAGIGLIGATLMPLLVLFDRDLTPLGTAFAGIVFAATAAVGIRRDWERLIAAGFVASAPQIAILIADGSPTAWDRVLLAAVFAGLYLASALGLQWVSEDEGLPTLSATLAIASGVLAGATGAALFTGDDRGWVVLAAAIPYAAVAVGLYLRPVDRDLSALLATIALALAAVGLAFVLSGPSLAVAWAAEAAALAWLSRRIDEPRYAVAAVAYLCAAALHAAFVDAVPDDLFGAGADPAANALAPLAVALAAGMVAYCSRPWEEREPPAGFFAYLEPALAWFREQARPIRLAAGWLAGIAGLYTASLALLGLAQALDDSSVELAFQRGHVLLLALWSVVAVSLVVVGRRRNEIQLTAGGLLLALAMVLQAATFDLVRLHGDRLGAALVVTAVGLLATAFADEFPAPSRPPLLSWPAVFLAAASVCFAVAGLLQLIEQEGLVLLGVTAFYLALAALVFRFDRDFSTALWAPALVVGVFASTELMDGTWVVLAWSAAAAALALLSRAVDEKRLALGSAAYLALAFGYALGLLAPPDEFFTANPDPAEGVPSLLCVVGAGIVFALYALDRPEWQPFRVVVAAGAAVLGMYAISLAILGAFEWYGPASVETDFQRGHSAVSAFWGIVGLVTLYVGLTRDLRVVRLAGFALFGLALAKLFVYDLANLSSVTRALSFLAVGAVLLLAGFFYQRLTAPKEPATAP
jgi:uncharacterized membrane protein